VCVCAEKDALGPQLQSQERVISCKNEEKASGSRKFERKASGKNESSVAVAAKDRYSIILYHTWIADCLQPLLHPQLLYTFRNRACLESHLSYSFTILHCLESHLSYILHILVCVCVCVCVCHVFIFRRLALQAITPMQLWTMKMDRLGLTSQLCERQSQGVGLQDDGNEFVFPDNVLC